MYICDAVIANMVRWAMRLATPSMATFERRRPQAQLCFPFLSLFLELASKISHGFAKKMALLPPLQEGGTSQDVGDVPLISGEQLLMPLCGEEIFAAQEQGLRWGYPPLNKHSWLKFLDFKHLKIGECSIAMLPEGYLTLPMTSFKSAPSRKSMSSQNARESELRTTLFFSGRILMRQL